MSNVDNNEVDKFSRLAKNWWNPNGELKTLHQVNPLRLKFIQKYTDLDSKSIIDIGCGGGILTESLTTTNNTVSGLDASCEAITIAKEHAKQNNATTRNAKQGTPTGDVNKGRQQGTPTREANKGRQHGTPTRDANNGRQKQGHHMGDTKRGRPLWTSTDRF